MEPTNATPSADRRQATLLPDEDRHRLRSQMQTVRVGLSLIDKQLELGRVDDARATCQKVIEGIEQLASDPSLNPASEDA